MNEYIEPVSGSERDLFWKIEEEIAKGSFFGTDAAKRLKAHMLEECYSKIACDDLVSVSLRGTRIYVMAGLYILESHYRLTIGVYEQSTEQGVAVK